MSIQHADPTTGKESPMVEELSSDELWTMRCIARFVALDPELKPELTEPIAVDLCARPRWRAMSPEGAAQAVFDLGKKA